MAIRLRTVGGVRVALCAAETDHVPGDLYLDDAEHHALAAKFRADWKDQQLTGWPDYPVEWAAMATQKLRDAETELNAWLSANDAAPVVDDVATAVDATRKQLQAENEKLLGTIEDMWTQFERLRDATNRRKCGQAFMVSGRHIAPWGIVDHAISALDLSMMREDRIDHERKRVERAEADIVRMKEEQVRWTNVVVVTATGIFPQNYVVRSPCDPPLPKPDVLYIDGAVYRRESP